jgi:hypothetical protein
MTPYFVYTPATTDIALRWRTVHGWVPPSKQKSFQKKWADFRAVSAQGAESLEAPKKTTVHWIVK